MIRNILVPLDGSRFGEHALPLALSIARKTNARVHLFHGHQHLDSPYAEMVVMDSTLDEQMRTQENAYLATLLSRVKEAFPGGVVTTGVGEGHVAAAIVDEVAAHKVDLVVMATHARGAMARFWLGSVTDELLRNSPVPLLLAHPQPSAPDLKRDVPLRHWLIPLDGTPLAEQILEPALHLGEAFGSDVTLLRVIRPVVPVVAPMGMGTFGAVAHEMVDRVEKLQVEVESDAKRYLAGVADRLETRRIPVETVVVVEDQPGVAIANRALKGVDAIAISTHGRRGLSRMFLGSTADKVIRSSQTPVLTFRPKA